MRFSPAFSSLWLFRKFDKSKQEESTKETLAFVSTHKQSGPTTSKTCAACVLPIRRRRPSVKAFEISQQVNKSTVCYSARTRNNRRQAPSLWTCGWPCAVCARACTSGRMSTRQVGGASEALKSVRTSCASRHIIFFLVDHARCFLPFSVPLRRHSFVQAMCRLRGCVSAVRVTVCRVTLNEQSSYGYICA